MLAAAAARLSATRVGTLESIVEKVEEAVSSARAEKLRMVFAECDADADGRLDIDGASGARGPRIQGGDEQKVETDDEVAGRERRRQPTFEGNGDAPMLVSGGGARFRRERRARPIRLDATLTEPDAADALHAKLAAYVASMETHATTRQSVRTWTSC